MQALEKHLLRLSQEGILRGSLHLATGQEALPAGACAALRLDDTLTVTYRGHGYVLAKGCDLRSVLAEILGKRTGLCRGKGGKMHLTDMSRGLLGANGIVGGGVGTAAGAALAAKMDGLDRVSMTVFGDGTLNQGHVHEVLNMAGLWKLPLIILCENNLYAEMTPLSESSAVADLSRRVESYGIASVRIDGNDVLAVYDTVAAAVKTARNGGGPSFIEALTYRTCGHYQNDPGTGYRSADEVAGWAAASPILRFEAYLSREHGLQETDLNSIRAAAATEVESALGRALADAPPAIETLEEGVFL